MDPCGSRAAHRPWLAHPSTDGRVNGRWSTSSPRGRPDLSTDGSVAGHESLPSPWRAVDGRARGETRVPVGFSAPQACSQRPWVAWPVAPWPWRPWLGETGGHDPPLARKLATLLSLATTNPRLSSPSDAPSPLIRTCLPLDLSPSSRDTAVSACCVSSLSLSHSRSPFPSSAPFLDAEGSRLSAACCLAVSPRSLPPSISFFRRLSIYLLSPFLRPFLDAEGSRRSGADHMSLSLHRSLSRSPSSSSMTMP